MTFLELLLISIGLSMDAFAAAICEGLCVRKDEKRLGLLVGIFFGGFQCFMPFLGYVLAKRFSLQISFLDHWIAFIFLALIGINMIKESREYSLEDPLFCDPYPNHTRIKDILLLSIATSIDAFAVGITFAFLNVNIYPAISIIGLTTFFISIFGFKLGTYYGIRFKSKAEFIGGALLILIGLHILIEHLHIL